MHSQYVELYIPITPVLRRKRTMKFNNMFIHAWQEVDRHIDRNMVFLDMHSALHYALFMDDNSGLLKLYLPESAIIGQYQKLTLKRGSIKKVHIHGCYPGWDKGRRYYENPDFNLTLVEKL